MRDQFIKTDQGLVPVRRIIRCWWTGTGENRVELDTGEICSVTAEQDLYNKIMNPTMAVLLGGSPWRCMNGAYGEQRTSGDE